MPLIRAAIKHLRKSQKLRTANRKVKDTMKQLVKDALKLGREKKIDELRNKLPDVFSIIDKATKKNLIHKNNAAHKKSRLSKLVAA